MKKRTWVLLVLIVLLTVIVAWAATEPNPYNYPPGSEPENGPFYWVYPAWMFFFGAVVFGLSFLERPLARFIGALVSFLLGAYLVVNLGLTVMHSPPVHGYLLYILFFSSLGLLFFSGYTCAIWRQQRHDDHRAN